MASGTGPIKVLHFGLGPIGAAVVKQVAARKGFKIVGAVDIDPAQGREGPRRGRRRSAARCGSRCPTMRRRRSSRRKPDVVVMCTSSSMKKVLPQIEAILKLKVPIVSTTEELAYPTKGNMRYARAIHQLAKKAKVAVLGTGVNPGFVMDALPITLTGVCERVEALRIDRVQDARIRRLPFQQKIGAGLTREQFQRKVDDGQRAPRRAGRVGVDDCRCARLEARQDHRRDPAADRDRDRGERVPRRRSPAMSAASSRTASATATACRSSRSTWRRTSARPSRSTRSKSTGSPALKMKIAGGVHGDIATASIVVNSLPKILEVAPGLHTMRDMPIPSFFGGVR